MLPFIRSIFYTDCRIFSGM